jgi:hypothetical protein
MQGADDCLPLLTPDKQQRNVGQAENAAASHRPNRNRDAAAVRPSKAARMPKHKGRQ